MPKILILTNSAGGLYNFRKELLTELVKHKMEVYVSSPNHMKVPKLQGIGCNYIKTNLDRRGTNPASDLKLFLFYIKIIMLIKPNVVLSYTIKPNVYGGIACRLTNTPYITNITGLGTALENNGYIQKLSMLLYKTGLKKSDCIFFQNKTNRHFFMKNKIAIGDTRLIPGSGVNLEYHKQQEYPNNDNLIRLLFIGRIMKDKGVDELIAAANMVRKNYPNVKFDLIGSNEEKYSELLIKNEKLGVINYHGIQDDVRSFIRQSHATILPSYHEGTANVLLESAASGRPVLASRVTGCKETFDEGVSGFGFEVKNADSLAETIVKFIELPNERKKAMGLAGRRKMEKEYDRKIVVKAYMEEIEKIVGCCINENNDNM